MYEKCGLLDLFVMKKMGNCNLITNLLAENGGLHLAKTLHRSWLWVPTGYGTFCGHLCRNLHPFNFEEKDYWSLYFLCQ